MKTLDTVTCAIVDDDPKAIQLLSLLIETEPRLKLVFTETDSLRAIKYLRSHPVELLFLDGVMPGIDGIGLARALIPQPKLILTTGYDELAMQAYDIGMADCIPKPVSLQRFTQAVHRAVGYRWAASLPPVDLDYILVDVKGGSKKVKIYFEDIIYIESKRNYLRIRLPSDDLLSRFTLSEINQMLPADQFIQVHRGFIVRLRLITNVFGKKKSWLQLQGADKEIPIGGDYRNALLERLTPRLP